MFSPTTLFSYIALFLIPSIIAAHGRHPARHTELALTKRAQCMKRTINQSKVSAYSTNESASVKRGLGLNLPDWVPMQPLSGHVGWTYNWSPWCSPTMQKLGIECVPMCWGWKQVSEFQQKLPTYQALGVKHLLGPNEPDQPGQSNMNPWDAANLWMQVFAPQKGKFKLVGPALTSSPGCIDWQRQFMSAVASAEPDYMALHWYGNSAQAMINYLNEFHAAFPTKSIWVTEYACQDFSGRNPCTDFHGFQAQVLNFMINTPWIARFAAFGYLLDTAGVDKGNQLIKPDGSGFSDLGWQYVNTN